MLHRFKFARNPGLIYVAPAVIVIAFVMLYPLIYTFYMSFNKSDIFSDQLKFVGFSQYVELFQDKLFLNSVKATLIWTVGSVFFQFLIGFVAAVVINQSFIRFKTGLRILIMVPWVLPSIIGVNIWKWSYHPDFGIINYILKSLGIISTNITWVSGADTALLSAIIVNVWKMYPFVMLMVEASLQSVPQQLRDAAKVDGAGPVRAFLNVTMPYIASTCYTVILLLTIWTFNAFTFIYALTEGGPAHKSEILSMYIYKFAFQNFDFGMASTASVVLFAITAAFAVVYIKFFLKGDERK
ncbi:carbohydrate ABC transporter permease [Paenibacillus eucommiae]|uniref:Multiple sugar transport system permease protein n=1 Tax=Paenibacillus eucommiae TaxID=1355755 RepID=A0ABS4J9R2_9BACL|nr:sugar ABC transporter permease [Paenibacillus eucommiae]MBP1995986.1 multiple sugar transport system permease protein [Paenibacillus eucommiae]